MSYRVVQNEKNKYDLMEKDTSVVIQLNRSEINARSLCRKLNLGSGFDGWTPRFFASRLDVSLKEA